MNTGTLQLPLIPHVVSSKSALLYKGGQLREQVVPYVWEVELHLMVDSSLERSGGQVLNMNINIGMPLVKISTSNNKRPNSTANFVIREESRLVFV